MLRGRIHWTGKQSGRRDRRKNEGMTNKCLQRDSGQEEVDGGDCGGGAP